jgi:tRNA dimethylallyltransferase
MSDQNTFSHTSPFDTGKPPLIVLVGPTAVGKTDLSLALAERFDGEIVNADSRSFYRGMDIGTAKVSQAGRARVPHHLIDILDPGDSVSLATFQDLAIKTIHDITARGRVPFLVGGTPQYVNALVEGWQIPRVEPDHAFRHRLERLADEHGVAHLQHRLEEIDPVAAGKIGSNLRRIIRALEVHEKTGRPISEQQTKGPAPFHALELELWLPRDVLYPRIDARVDAQIADGLFDEIRSLLERGVSPDAASFSSIGYRQALPFLRGETSREDAIARIKHDTHRLVRHQETWWRKNPRLLRIDMARDDAFDVTSSAIENHLQESRSVTNSGYNSFQ